MTRLRRKLQTQGFTLIETLIVMVMMGLMATIATPSLFGFLARAEVNRGFTSLKGALQVTQREAMKRSQSCVLTLPRNDSENGVLTSDCLITGAEQLADVKIKYNRATSTNVNFNFRGHTNSHRTIVIYSDKTNWKKCMVISNGIGMMRQGTYTRNDLTTISADYCQADV